jgi:ribonuclease D
MRLSPRRPTAQDDPSEAQLWVDDDAGLQRVLATLASEPEYGLDTEFVAERSYWPVLCLVQLSWAGGVAIVDPLACDVRALADLLQPPATMVTHAGAADLPILERVCAARPTTLFDTQIAAGFVGLGMPSLVALVSALLDIRLDKKEQLTDWARRPLPDAARRYAAGDVLHLLPLAAELRTRLESMGRDGWAAAECEVLRTVAVRDPDPDTVWWRIKGSRALRGERARVAQAVAAWRERRARELDRPTRFVLSELVLAGIAARPPHDARELTDLRGAGSLPKEVARVVLEAVEAGRAMDPAELRLPPRHEDDGALDAAAALLAAWTGQVAATERIEPRLLATRDDVKAMVNGRRSRLDEGWRAAIVGARIRGLVAGDAVLRLVDGGRRVRLEPSQELGSPAGGDAGQDGGA